MVELIECQSVAVTWETALSMTMAKLLELQVKTPDNMAMLIRHITGVGDMKSAYKIFV
jgi:hypothetical protein